MLFILCSCSNSSVPLKIYSADNELLAELKSSSDISGSSFSAYLDIVLDEAAVTVASLLKCDAKRAEKHLFKDGFSVYTAFDKQVFEGLEDACKDYADTTDIGCAVTDIKGNLTAVYSTKRDSKSNFATALNPPCSAFKPLSVYAPAIESGKINWSSYYTDSPYKQIKNDNGVLSDWPVNANNIYTEQPTGIYEAIKHSYNTVAVKCLADVGVKNSLVFLEDKFSLSLETERYNTEVHGEEEVIGNIALGYLAEGVSVVDMSGYYQCFANGGLYKKPEAVLKICDADGTEVYKNQNQQKQVIKPSTADIMRELLKGVVNGGTGTKATCKGIEVAGKTGTDDSGSNNWFVGITPEFSLAVWHSQSQKNIAAELFSKEAENIYNLKQDLKTDFALHSNIRKFVCCEQSGKAVSTKCTSIQLGYFEPGNTVGVCDIHK